jgi:PKD repeat protein
MMLVRFISFSFLIILVGQSKSQIPQEQSIKLWFSSEYIEVNNENISSIFDISQNINHAIQEQDERQARTFFSSDLNYPVMVFSNASNDPHYYSIDQVDFTNSNYTFFIVSKRNVFSTPVSTLFGGPQQACYLGGVISGGLNPGLGANGVNLRTAEDIDSNWTIFTFKSDSIRIDGVNVATNPSAAIPSISFSRLGVRPDNLNLFFQGFLLEMILYEKRLNSVETRQVETYLREKYFPSVKRPENQDCVPPGYGLQSNIIADSILWSTGSNADSIEVTEPGTYWVYVRDIFGFESSDTITINGIFDGAPSPLVSTNICLGDSALLNTGLSNEEYTFLWNTSDTTSQLYVLETGTYSVVVSDANSCILYDTAYVLVDQYPVDVALEPNPILCREQSVGLLSGAPSTVSYQWFNSEDPETPLSFDSLLFPTQSGQYWVTTENVNGCIGSDSTLITYYADIMPPSAGYSYSLACETQSIQFTDTSLQSDAAIVSWQWEIDTLISTDENPVVLFDSSGVYEVKLRVQNEVGCADQRMDSIEVFPKPIPGFEPLQNYCAENLIRFVDTSLIQSGNIDSVVWSFTQDTSWVLDGPSVSQRFLDAGWVTLSLSIYSEKGCKAVEDTSFLIRSRPSGSFLTDTVCFGAELTASAFWDSTSIEPAFYEWLASDYSVLGDSVVLILETGENTSYPLPGQYGLVLVSLTSDKYCSDTLFSRFNLFEHPRVDYTSDKQCVNSPSSFEALLINPGFQTLESAFWIVNNDTVSDELSFSFVPVDTGNYSIALYTSTNYKGCTQNLLDTLFYYNFPEVEMLLAEEACIHTNVPIEAVSDSAPSNSNLSYFWSVENMPYPSTDSIIYPLFPKPGNQRIALTAINSGNCETRDSVNIAILGPQLSSSADPVCAQDTVEIAAAIDLTYSNGIELIWVINDQDSVFMNPLHASWENGGFYTVLAIATDTVNFCSDSDTLLVKVSDLPTAQFNIPRVCDGNPANFFSTSTAGNDPIGSYQWESEQGSGSGASFTIIPDEPGSYFVTHWVETLEAGCVDSISQEFEVLPPPNASFVADPVSGPVPLPVGFTASPDLQFYQWNFGNGSSSTEPNPDITFLDTGIFVVQLTVFDSLFCSNQHIDSIHVYSPFFDLALLQYEPFQDGSLVRFRFKVSNKGYFPVYAIKIQGIVGTENQFETTEQIFLNGGDTAWVETGFGIAGDLNTIDYTCLALGFADDQTDDFPENNRLCRSINPDAFKVLSLFPNPGESFLNIRLHAPEEGELLITISNAYGQEVERIAVQLISGIQDINLPTNDLNSGNYRIRLQFNNSSFSIPWMKIKR